MELINEFMYVDAKINQNINQSFCKSTESEHHIFLNLGLNANDCSFDLAENNYEFLIRISKSYFEKYAEPIELNITQQTICCNTQVKLLELINCQLTGINRKIFLESTILFLLYQSQKNSLIFQLGCNNCTILNKPIEVEKIEKAKKYILKNLTGNLTIPIIATNVGTNQCYLKKGFKEVFKQTIFEFIQENRMIKAKRLLENPSFNVTEIAFSVGYSSLSSFSQAYKNYFGISPTEQAKQEITNK